MIGLTLPVIILGSLALALADYLYRRFLAPPVPSTTPLSAPYTPPFTGGQCVGIQYRITYNQSAHRPDYTDDITNATIVLNGAVSIQRTVQGEQQQLKIFGGGVIANTLAWLDYRFDDPVILSVLRTDGLIDNCGDIPNPNPALPIGGGGLAQSPPPILYPPPNNPNNNFFTLVAGIAAVAAAAATAAVAAAAAAAAAAEAAAVAAVAAAEAAAAASVAGSAAASSAASQASLAAAIGKIAQAIAEIVKLITGLEKEIRKLKTKEADKDKEKAENVVRYDFGSANRDGFLKLYPESNPDTFKATFVDIQIFNIPTGSGKYFGEKSPHYYKYKSLGQIHFVSPTFGILESREIDFARLSLNVPDNCFGFFYHFGLDGIVSANISGFYTKTEKQAV